MNPSLWLLDSQMPPLRLGHKSISRNHFGYLLRKHNMPTMHRENHSANIPLRQSIYLPVLKHVVVVLLRVVYLFRGVARHDVARSLHVSNRKSPSRLPPIWTRLVKSDWSVCSGPRAFGAHWVGLIDQHTNGRTSYVQGAKSVRRARAISERVSDEGERWINEWNCIESLGAYQVVCTCYYK